MKPRQATEGNTLMELTLFPAHLSIKKNEKEPNLCLTLKAECQKGEGQKWKQFQSFLPGSRDPVSEAGKPSAEASP